MQDSCGLLGNTASPAAGRFALSSEGAACRSPRWSGRGSASAPARGTWGAQKDSGTSLEEAAPIRMHPDRGIALAGRFRHPVLMSYSRLLVHAVLVCDGRHRWLHPEIRTALVPYLAGLVMRQNGALLIGNGIEDHLHVLLSLAATRSLSETMRDLKANSSRWLRHEHALRIFSWQREFAAFSVSPSIRSRVEAYIAAQEEHHRRRDLREEMLLLLRAHGLKPDPRDPWLGNVA